MAVIFDFKSRKRILLNTLQQEWVESVAHEAIDNLDAGDIIDLIEGMDQYYGDKDPA